jgi:hypothetical protein
VLKGVDPDGAAEIAVDAVQKVQIGFGRHSLSIVAGGCRDTR